MSIRLKQISIEGCKSIRRLDGFETGDLTVRVGANGAGKSNLISLFRALSHIMLPSEKVLALFQDQVFLAAQFALASSPCR